MNSKPISADEKAIVDSIMTGVGSPQKKDVKEDISLTQKEEGQLIELLGEVNQKYMRKLLTVALAKEIHNDLLGLILDRMGLECGMEWVDGRTGQVVQLTETMLRIDDVVLCPRIIPVRRTNEQKAYDTLEESVKERESARMAGDSYWKDTKIKHHKDLRM